MLLSIDIFGQFQGIRIRLGEHFQRIVSFPTGLIASGCSADLGAAFSLRSRTVRQAEQDRQVVLRLFLADATVFLVQYPVDWVPGAPEFEGGIQEQSGIGERDGFQIRCRCFGG